MNTSRLILIGCPLGLGAGKPGCEFAPSVIQQAPGLASLNVIWQMLPEVTATARGLAAMLAISEHCRLLADATYDSVAAEQRFCVVGGDQSCSAGTWSGVAARVQELGGQLGLIWLDAHMDSHTPTTTESGNIHGMPMAALLGHGDPQLTQLLTEQPKLLPENVCLIGIRSYESSEAELLNTLGVKVYYAEEVNARGIDIILQEAVAHVTAHTSGFGLAIDCDGFDPNDAPAVGTPEPLGIDANQAYPGLQRIGQHPKFLGAEIVEFNPTLPGRDTTEAFVIKLILTLFAESSS